MSVVLTINSQSFDYPTVGDNNWGAEATDWAVAVTNGMLQKAGGTFQLLAEVDFGTTYGLKSLYYKSRTADVADDGQIRLARVDTIAFRNEANDDNLFLGVSDQNRVQFNGDNLATGTDLTEYVQKVTYSAKGSILAATAAGLPNNLSVGTNGFVLTADSSTPTGLKWAAAGNGDVIGPASSTDNAVARFDGTTGKVIQNSSVTISDSGTLNCGIVGPSLFVSLLNQASVVLYEQTINGTNNITLRAPASLTNSYNFNLPSDAGTANQMLGTTNGSDTAWYDVLRPGLAQIVDADISASAAISVSKTALAVSDTSSVDLTLSTNTISAALKLSTSAPDPGAFNAVATIETDGLQVQVPTNNYASQTNVSVACSVGSSALTIALKTPASADPSANTPVVIPFRSNSATSGIFEVPAVTSALSVVVPSGATLGLNSGTASASVGAGYIYVYAINNSGTVELAVNSQWQPDGIISTSAISSTSDTSGFFSTSARTNVACRMIARLRYDTMPNGTYSSVPSQISLGNDATLRVVGEVIVATSASKTPTSASAQYSQMTSNSIILQPGLWRLNTSAAFSSSGGNAFWTYYGVGPYGSNGADSASLPTLLNATTGVTVVAGALVVGSDYAFLGFALPATSTNVGAIAGQSIFIQVDRTVTLFGVPFTSLGTAANGRILTQINAERIS